MIHSLSYFRSSATFSFRAVAAPATIAGLLRPCRVPAPTALASMQTAHAVPSAASGLAMDAANGNKFQLVVQLINPEQRESALLELSKKREAFTDLAPILWHSFGTISALLQEIVAIYPSLSPPQLTAHASNRVCNALALLQCVASHPETRTLFLNGKYCPWASSLVVSYLPVLVRVPKDPSFAQSFHDVI